MPGALNDKQQRFAEEYVRDLNATQAAIRAGYSAKTAEQQGSRLLRHVKVQAEVSRLKAQRSKRTAIDADWVLQQLARIAGADVRKVFRGTELVLPEDIDDETAAAIAAIEVVTVSKGEGEVEHVAKIRMVDKLRALELLGRHLKLFTDKIEVDISDGLASKLAKARQRAQS